LGLQLKIIYVFITSVRIALFASLMSIVARGDVVYEFYMEQSFIDFCYIFPLKSKHSPQGSGLNLCSCYSKHNCTRPSGDPSSSPGISMGAGGGGWMETTWKIRHIEVTENSLFYVSRITWCSTTARARARAHARTHTHTHTHIHLHPAPCLHTSKRFAWI